MVNLSAGYKNYNFKCFRQKDKDGDNGVSEFFGVLKYPCLNPKEK
jgi:hypothetical protein